MLLLIVLLGKTRGGEQSEQLELGMKKAQFEVK